MSTPYRGYPFLRLHWRTSTAMSPPPRLPYHDPLRARFRKQNTVFYRFDATSLPGRALADIGFLTAEPHAADTGRKNTAERGKGRTRLRQKTRRQEMPERSGPTAFEWNGAENGKEKVIFHSRTRSKNIWLSIGSFFSVCAKPRENGRGNVRRIASSASSSPAKASLRQHCFRQGVRHGNVPGHGHCWRVSVDFRCCRHLRSIQV